MWSLVSLCMFLLMVTPGPHNMVEYLFCKKKRLYRLSTETQNYYFINKWSEVASGLLIDVFEDEIKWHLDFVSFQKMNTTLT